MLFGKEKERLKALYSYKIMDTDAEKHYDSITNLAAYICKTQMAAINMVDDSRVWIKSKVGLDACELSKDTSFCKHTILKETILEVKDTLLDDRFKYNPFVIDSPYIRYYAGIPLINPEGFILGTICVFDCKPNQLDDKQKETLQFLADEVILHLEAAKKNFKLQELNTEQQKFQSLFDNSGEIHCISDINRKILFVNNAVKQLLGYEIEEVIGQSILAMLPPDDQQLINNSMLEIEANNCTCQQLELTVKAFAKNGELKWLSLSNVFQNHQWLINARDVTHQIIAEQELQQLSLVASHVTNGVVINNEKNEILWVNKAFETLTGYTLNDVKGKKLRHVITGEATDRQMLEYAGLQASNKSSFTIEILAYNKNQEEIWLSVVNSVILNEQEEIVKSIEIIKDITERKKTELELKTLSEAVTKSAVGVMIRNGEDQVMWMNNALEEILGWKLEELKGAVLNKEFIGELTDLQLYSNARKRLINKQSYDIEIVLYRKDKTPVWLSVYSNPLLNEQGKVERQLSIFMDITVRKKAEQELIRTREEAVQLSRAKETFISVMSHEIRTPINAIIGMSRILLEENPAQYQLENLNILKFSSENLLTLVNDVLDFTKIETGNMSLESVPVNLKELAKRTLHTLEFKLDGKNFKLALYFDEKIPDYVLADSTRLYQIMMNLLGNAVKFTEKGEVKLSLSLEKENQETVTIKFCVSDTGIGIPENKLTSIFEAYSQASTDTTRKYGGTGLGLSITKKLIELHHSTIQVKSELGVGSQFSFTINFTRTIYDMPKAVSTPVQENLPGLVLVADDNLINRTLAKKVLSKWAIETDLAENGQQVYEMVQQKDYDLILMDLHMPVMDGLEATKKIRLLSAEKYKTLPIIALTGSVFGLDLEDLHQDGLTDHFLKPYTPEGLYNKIKFYLKKEEVLQK